MLRPLNELLSSDIVPRGLGGESRQEFLRAVDSGVLDMGFDSRPSS